MGLIILLGLFAFCVVIGLPVAFALGIAAVATFAWEGLPILIAFQRIISGISMFSLLAIPFFIFAGELMFHGGIAVVILVHASWAGNGTSCCGGGFPGRWCASEVLFLTRETTKQAAFSTRKNSWSKGCENICRAI